MNRAKEPRLQAESSSLNKKDAVTTFIFRALIALNFTRFILSFFPWFEGTSAKPGFADEFFGRYRLGGFRVDLIWLVASTALIFYLLRYISQTSKNTTKGRLDLYLGIAWILAFIIFLARAVLSGVLYFG